MTSPAALLLLAGLFRPSAAQTPPPPPAFEVASVRLSPPDHGHTTLSPSGAQEFRVTSVSMLFLIDMAFNVNPNLTAGAPSWAESTLYDVSAKPDGDAGLSYTQLEPYLQTLLKDRFHLQAHFEKRERNGFALVVARGGPRLQQSADPAPAANSAIASIFSEGLRGASIPLRTLASMLASSIGSPVIDGTGLTGNYDITLKFANPRNTPNDTAADPSLPSIFTAVTEQLGLRLNRQKVSLDVLVIDHVDKLPSAN